MALSPGLKRLLLLAALGAVALGLAGFITGAIGASFRGASPLLPPPHVELAAERLPWHLGPLPLRNTYLSAWLATLVLIGLFLLALRKRSIVPGRLQSLAEVIVEGLLNFIKGVVGEEKARALLPVIATIFLFVSFNAWLALLPIYPSLGFFKTVEEHGETKTVLVPLLRSAGTDLNMPLALAVVSFIFVESWGFRTLGLSYAGKFVRVGNLLRGRVLLGGIDLFVGVLEGFSELVRIISFTFRLFGNMTAGEILVVLSAFLVSFVFTVPFYGLEILVGFVQALIFAGLTLVFTVVAITPHGEGGH